MTGGSRRARRRRRVCGDFPAGRSQRILAQAQRRQDGSGGRRAGIVRVHTVEPAGVALWLRAGQGAP
jgi:hypothetical protein